MRVDHSPVSFWREAISALKEQNLYRRPKVIESLQDSWVTVEGRRVLNLCSNNYLGLASHPEVKEAAAQAISEWGCGSGASRLICGNQSPHELLERRLAAFKGAEDALLYTSGYMANVGIISALVGRRGHIFSDELNHASIIDGCRLSGAGIQVFPHNDMDALEDRLRRTASASPRGRRLIVVDSVFSMDGDLAPLPELVGLAERYDCLLMVDEAHATGVLGEGGRGAVSLFGLTRRVPVVMSTLSKALGSLGGFATGSRELREYLVNTSRSFIFSTAPPAAMALAAIKALDLLEGDPSLPVRVQRNAEYWRDGLKSVGYDTGRSRTQIVPVVIGDANRTLEISQRLLHEGVLATPIRPPTVPEATCRIRTTVMATHTKQDLDFALAAFEKVGKEIGL